MEYTQKDLMERLAAFEDHLLKPVEASHAQIAWGRLAGERYVDRRQLAEIMGVSVRQIDRWTAEGMPSEVWGVRCRRFQPSRALAWARTPRELPHDD